MRTGRVMLVALVALGPSSLQAERVILKDGSVLQGQLLSYSGGFYELQIGKFIKQVPESSIVTVEGDDAAPVRPATSVSPPGAAPATVLAPGAPGASGATPGSLDGGAGAVPTTPSTALPPGSPGRAGSTTLPGMPGLPDLTSLQGMDLKSLGKVTQMLGPLLGSGGSQGDVSIPAGSALSDVLGRIMRESSVMSQGPEAASKSPGFQQLHAKLADPAFQQQLMQELRALQQQTGNNEAAGMIQMLEGLLGQLAPPPTRSR